MVGCWLVFVERLRNDGGKILTTLTILQAVLFIVQSVYYSILYDRYNDDSYETDPSNWYVWIQFIILLVGQIYFLISATLGKNKNPNELYSYLAIAMFINVICLGTLIILCRDIARDWLGIDVGVDEDLHAKTLGLFIMGIVFIVITVFVIVMIILTTKPLRERIYEEIFWQIGANMNLVENHKTKTLFIGACKVDLLVHLLFINTFAFLNYNFTK